MKFDLHDFFQSINEYRVFSLYRNIGFNPLISLELARICTRDSVIVGRRTIDAPRIDRYTAIPAYRSGSLGFVPQGSPTSGAIANIIAGRLDQNMQRLATDIGLTYTRYADDIVLSGSGKFSRDHCHDVIREVRQIIRNNGFRMHEKKTQVIPPGARHVVLGVVLTDEGITLGREIKRRIEHHLFGAERFHIQHHAKHQNFTSILGFVHHVRGLLAFAADVDSAYARPLKARWDAIERRDGSALATSAFHH